MENPNAADAPERGEMTETGDIKTLRRYFDDCNSDAFADFMPNERCPSLVPAGTLSTNSWRRKHYNVHSVAQRQYMESLKRRRRWEIGRRLKHVITSS
jgi:hypothetical protein